MFGRVSEYQAYLEGFFGFFYISYIIHCKIKRHNHRVPKTVRVPGNKTNPKKIK